MEIHPELAKLRASYERIVADYTAGHLTDEQARMTLQAMRILDASGAAWGIDLDGRFVRQRTAYEPPEPTPPAMFALVATGGAPGTGSDPWDELAAAGEVARPVVDPGPLPTPLSERISSRLARMRQHDDPDPFSPSYQKTGSKLRRRLADAKFLEIFNKHRTTIVVVLAMLVLLFATSALRGTRNTATPLSTTNETTTTAQTGTAAPATTQGEQLPVTTLAEPKTTSAQPAVVVPTVDEMKIVVLKLRDRDSSAATVDEGTSQSELAGQAAFWNGLAPAGLSMRFEEAAVDGKKIVSRVVLEDAQSGQMVTSVSLSWRQVDGVWKLARWPQLPSEFD